MNYCRRYWLIFLVKMQAVTLQVGLNTRIVEEYPINSKSLESFALALGVYINSRNHNFSINNNYFQKYLSFLQNADRIELIDQFTFGDIIVRALSRSNKKIDSFVISVIIELLRLKVLPSTQILNAFNDNEQAYNAASRVINDDYSSLKLEDLQYIPHKYLVKLQAITSIPEIQWSIAKNF